MHLLTPYRVKRGSLAALRTKTTTLSGSSCRKPQQKRS